jgi:hypothetical protein
MKSKSLCGNNVNGASNISNISIYIDVMLLLIRRPIRRHYNFMSCSWNLLVIFCSMRAI